VKFGYCRAKEHCFPGLLEVGASNLCRYSWSIEFIAEPIPWAASLYVDNFHPNYLIDKSSLGNPEPDH
jgi:hypothetical protein